MSDDLQGDIPEESADLGTAEEQQKPEQPDAAQKAINKKHFQFKQAERERDEERKKREELEQRLAALESQKVNQEIPPLPDAYDDDFETKIREREAAITRKAEIEAQNKLREDQQRLANEQAQREALEQKQKIVNDYTARAADLGVKPEELQLAGGQVEAYGVTPEFTDYLLTHEEGPLIVKHLAANLADIETINNMTPYQQAVYVETQIKPKLEALKPRITEAPGPATNINGGGVDVEAGKYVYSKGATFE